MSDTTRLEPTLVDQGEGPATIVLIKPIIIREELSGQLMPVVNLQVKTFKRCPASLTFEYNGKRREVFFANIAEIQPHG